MTTVDSLLSLTPPQKTVWCAMLGVFSRETVSRAIVASCLTSAEHPDVAEVIACCRRIEPNVAMVDVVSHATAVLFESVEDGA